MTYYKATRPDGLDFYSSSILYEVGKRIRPHQSDRRKICGPGYLHASDEMAMTLVGGSWPCKLFEVDGKPEVGFDTTHPHKGGFRQLTVVRELPAHWALGPNGLIVSKVIERTRRVTYDEARELDAAWGAALDAARDAARGAARDAARGAARDAAWGAAWGAARGAAWGAARDAARGAALEAARDAARGAARDAAWGAARDAAIALLVQDLISKEHFDKLYGPWLKVIGELR